MGIDLIRGGRIKNRGARDTKTSNAYIKTLIKVQMFGNIALWISIEKN